MDVGKMEIFGINLNEFKMVKGSLEVKMTIRKILLMKISLSKNCVKWKSRKGKIALSKNRTKQKLH